MVRGIFLDPCSNSAWLRGFRTDPQRSRRWTRRSRSLPLALQYAVKNRRRLHVLTRLAIAYSPAALLHAQGNGTIHGTVTDPSGAAVSDAKVIALLASCGQRTDPRLQRPGRRDGRDSAVRRKLLPGASTPGGKNAGKREGLLDAIFHPGTGHRPHFVTKPVAFWFEKQLDFPNWTNEDIEAMPTTHISEWAQANAIDSSPWRRDNLYSVKV